MSERIRGSLVTTMRYTNRRILYILPYLRHDAAACVQIINPEQAELRHWFVEIWNECRYSVVDDATASAVKRSVLMVWSPRCYTTQPFWETV